MTDPIVTLSADDVRILAGLAGVFLGEDEVASMAERFRAILGALALVSDADLASVEPAFVRPLPPVAS